MSGDMMGYNPQDTFDSCESEKDCSRRKENAKNRQHTEHKHSGKHPKDVFDELLGTIAEKEKEIDKLKKTNQRLLQEKKETEKRSMQLTSEMAQMMDLKGTFENTDDECSKSKLSERFQKLYSNDWVHLSRWIGKTFPALSELQIIHYLTKLMKLSYQECLMIADTQLCHFLLLDMTDKVPTNEQHQELFSLRRKYAQTKAMRMKIKQVISDKLLLGNEFSDYFKGENKASATEKIKDFFNNFLDCCWLMVVSNPPIRLNFNVKEKTYRDHIEQFSIYSLKTPVDDMSKEEGTVYEVVWPSVCLHDESAFYQKGDVVVVRTGRKPNHSDCHCCSFKSYQGGDEGSSHCTDGGDSLIRKKRSGKTKTTAAQK